MTESREKWIEAGKIASKIMQKAVSLAKPGVPLLEIAEQVEKEAEKLNVKFAFPINLSIDEIAAHYSPQHEDKILAGGLLKIDLGISMNGFISDMSRTIDLTPEGKHKKLIESSNNALKEAIKKIKEGIEIKEIGKTIQENITRAGFAPIRNLSGHSMERNSLHAGITIPNYDNGNSMELEAGIYAIEPFSTTGEGVVMDGKPSGIYLLKQVKPIRDAKTREILEFIEKEYSTLPFSARWLVKKFGLRSLVSLKMLEQNGTLYQFSHLIEKSRAPVSQSEHTILVEKGKITVLTE